VDQRTRTIGRPAILCHAWRDLLADGCTILSLERALFVRCGLQRNIRFRKHTRGVKLKQEDALLFLVRDVGFCIGPMYSISNINLFRIQLIRDNNRSGIGGVTRPDNMAR
jgi:hypothetical protein